MSQELPSTKEHRPRGRIRVMLAKVGLDGHDRGVKVVARALRDAGMEVIYTGIRQTPEAIASAAVQEGVDFVGLSSLSGAHNRLFPEVVRLLRRAGASGIAVFGGGVIPAADAAKLKKAGVKEIFLPGASTQDIVKWLRHAAQRGRR